MPVHAVHASAERNVCNIVVSDYTARERAMYCIRSTKIPIHIGLDKHIF